MISQKNWWLAGLSLFVVALQQARSAPNSPRVNADASSQTSLEHSRANLPYLEFRKLTDDQR
jgi:hypothetical protein